MPKKNTISVKGAKENNLKNISLEIPKGKLVAFTGMSGAGKSTLAHQVIAKTAEQRFKRLKGENITLSPNNPHVDSIDGLPPCIELPQEPLRGQARSTVGTYSGLQHLFAGLLLHSGEARSPKGQEVVEAKGKELAEWLFAHYKDSEVEIAITPGKDNGTEEITSSSQIKTEYAYYREPRTHWQKVLKQDARKTFSSYWTVAIPDKKIKIKTKDDAYKLVDEHESYLLVIDKKVFVESKNHRISIDEAFPYEKLGRDLFSFNSSAVDGGQCDKCKGLGETLGVFRAGLIADNKKGVFDGGLKLPYKNGQFVHMNQSAIFVRGLLKKNNIAFSTPLTKLPKDILDTIFDGSGDELVPEMRSEQGELHKPKRAFEGIIPELLERVLRRGPASIVFAPLTSITVCPDCLGCRYNRSARASLWAGKTICELFHTMTIDELYEHIDSRVDSAPVKSIVTLLSIYKKLNLGYLNLSRATSTLSGGEAQRLKLGSILALQVTDALYILDEPSRGLHNRDMLQLAEMLRLIVNQGNSLILVEHQPILIASADHVITLGPEGGSKGGLVIHEGKPKIKVSTQKISFKKSTKPDTKAFTIKVLKMSINNLNEVSFDIPEGVVTAVVGVSGAGKSSAILKGLVPAAELYLDGVKTSKLCSLSLPKSISFVEIVGQKLSSQNRRSIVATAIEMFDTIRNSFAKCEDSSKLNLKPADFSFNSSGACPTCTGTGVAKDGFGQETNETCQVCGGTRFNSAARLLQIEGKDIADILNLSIDDLIVLNHSLFVGMPSLQVLSDLKLGHLSLGRSTSTLSAGERQRLALARFIVHVEKHKEKGLLVLDEPTSGLSVEDAQIVFKRIQKLAEEQGHTIIVLEHKIEFLEHADWVLEFGPGGGPKGGKLIYEGLPSGLAKEKTPTADILKYSTESHVLARTPAKIRLESPSKIEWEKSAKIFESLVSRLEVKDDVEFTPPVRPAIVCDISNISPNMQVGEILNLLPWAEKNGTAKVSAGVTLAKDLSEVRKKIANKDFYFSPVSSEFRNGIAIAVDLKKNLKKLKSFGFRVVAVNGEHKDIVEILKLKVLNIDIVKSCLVLCSSDASESLRGIAFRWSLGVVYLKDFTKITSSYVNRDSNIIGLPTSSVQIGNRHSPIARCTQCNGQSTVPTYPLDLILKDTSSSIKNIRAWHPALQKAIMSLGRQRIFPQIEFFKNNEIADFIQPFSKMDAFTKTIFEHGIPWREFLKTNATRSDRESDYFGWRGIHDYVYLALPAVTDVVYKEKMKNSFKYISCPVCDGTGMSWEARFFDIKGKLLQKIWQLPLTEWVTLGCKDHALKCAISEKLGALKPSDRFEKLNEDQKEKLHQILIETTELEGVKLIRRGI